MLESFKDLEFALRTSHLDLPVSSGRDADCFPREHSSRLAYPLYCVYISIYSTPKKVNVLVWVNLGNQSGAALCRFGLARICQCRFSGGLRKQ